jgi:hypothetical protein
LRTQYFAEKPKIQKSTWQPLIHIVLGFTRSVEDAHLYQRDKVGRCNGDMALIELSSIASKSLSDPADRERYQLDRIEAVRNQLEHRKSKPVLAVFYGTTYTRQYSRIAGGPFDADGFRWNGRTLCALTTHPSRPTRTYAYWTEYGRRLREMVDRRNEEGSDAKSC